MSSEKENKVFFKSSSVWPVYLNDKTVLYNVSVDVDNGEMQVSKDYPNGDTASVLLIELPGTDGFQISDDLETHSLVANWLDTKFEYKDTYSKLTATYPLEYIAVMISAVVKMNGDFKALDVGIKRRSLTLVK